VSGFEIWVGYLDTIGTLGVLAVVGWGFYTRRIRLGTECDRVEAENVELRKEVKQLWSEKVEDAREAADVARAYVKIREQEK
jgi:hypothetical protein